MANPERSNKPDVARSEQGVLNNSFDETYKVLAVVPVSEYAATLLRLQADSAGNLKMNDQTAFIPAAHDYKSLAQTSTTDVWTYKSGGSGGTTVFTVTYTYTDSTKTTIASIQRN